MALEALLAPGLELGGELAGVGLPADHHRLDPGQPVHQDLDDGALVDGRVLGQGLLHLHRRHPQAADLEHVVDPALVPPEPVGVLAVAVSRPDPVAQHRPLGLLVLAPVAGQGAVAADVQVAGLALGDGLGLVAEQLEVVAGHGRAAGPGPQPVGGVGAEDVQHLGGADAVEDGQAVGVVPAPPDLGRQRLGGRDAQPHRRQVPLGCLGGGQHGVVEGRDREQQARPVALDGVQDPVGGGPAVELDRGRPDPERERQAVAEAVGVEQLGGREAEVALADVQHLGGVGLAGVGQVVLEVDDPLGPAGGAGAVQPEGGVVAVGRGRVQLAGVGGQQVVQGVGVAGGAHGDAVGHHQPDRLRVAGQRLGDLGQQVGVGHHHPGLAVGEEILVVLGLEQRVDRDRDHPGPDGAQEHRREGRGVVHDHQHPLLALDAEGLEGPPGRAGHGQQPLVADLAVLADDGRLGPAPGFEIPVQDGADVVALGHLRRCHLGLTPRRLSGGRPPTWSPGSSRAPRCRAPCRSRSASAPRTAARRRPC